MNQQNSNFDVSWLGNAADMLAFRAGKKVPYARQLADAVLPFKWQDFLRNEAHSTPIARDFIARSQHFLWRYMTLNVIFETFEPKLGIEFGAGFTMRGMEAVNEGYAYVEVDRPDLIAHKRPAVESIIGSNNKLRLIGMDVTNEPDLDSFLACVPEVRTLFIMEALFPYIGGEHQDMLLSKLLHLLPEREGKIVLTDIYLRGDIESRIKKERGELIGAGFTERDAELYGEITRRQWASKRFATYDEASGHFTSLGYSVTTVGIHDPTHIIRSGDLFFGRTLEEADEAIVWILETA